MKILGINTSTKFLCLGVYDNARVYEYNLEAGTRLSSLLTLSIKRVLDTLGWKPEQIDYFACGLGPGSFTGLRLGLAAVKAMAWALRKPVIGISSLEILARNVKTGNTCIAPVIDAKRNLVYCGAYRRKDSLFKKIRPDRLLTMDEFLKRIKTDTLMLGDAVGLYGEKILAHKNVTILDKDYWYPRAGNIIEAALEKIKAKEFYSPFDVLPIYLYPKECQIRKASV